MKRYEGLRAASAGGATVTVCRDEGHGWKASKPLNPRFDLRRHSPDGFQWGYGGSGPAQLALALLADATGDDDLAQRHYQEFKFRVIARLQADHWQLTQAAISEWIENAEARRPEGHPAPEEPHGDWPHGLSFP
jgi:hypothetical protein